jgi:hypothetical protein
MAETPKVSIKDADILTLLRPDLDAAKVSQDQWAIKRESSYKAFRGAPYGNERDGWSKSVAPLVWTQHQSQLASLVEIFADEFFTLKSDNTERATAFQKLLRYQMFRKQDGYKKITDFLFNALLYPLAVFKVFHKDDYELSDEQYAILDEQQMQMLSQDPQRQVTKYDEVQGESSVDPMGNPLPPSVSFENVKVIKKDIKYSGPAFEVVQPWAFGYSSDCKIAEWGGIDGRLIYHGPFKLTLNDIRKREKAGVYRKGTFDKCKDLGTGSLVKGVDELAVEVTMDGVSETYIDGSRSETPSSKEDLTKELSVKECYVKLDIDKDGLLEHCIVTIIEDDVVAQVEENPYGRAPFRVGSMLPEPHKVHGIAPPSILEHEQKIETNLLRFIQDTAAQSCYRNPVTNDVRMQQMLQERKPFDVILGDPTRLGEVKTSPPDQFILKAWELLKGTNEETTGNSRYNQGSDGESLNKTATGISLISQASAKRLRMGAKALGNGAITGVIKDFIFINQKWPSQDPIKLLGQDITINPGDLEGDYDIEIDIGVSPAERQAIANQIDLLIQFGTQAGMQMGIMQPPHILKAIKKKFSQLNIVVDDLLMSEPEFKQAEQQKQQQPPQPDPAQQQMQMQQEQAQVQAQQSQTQFQMKMQENQQKMQFEAAKQSAEMEKMHMAAQLEQMKMQGEMEKLQLSIQQAREQHVLKMREMDAATQALKEKTNYTQETYHA